MDYWTGLILNVNSRKFPGFLPTNVMQVQRSHIYLHCTACINNSEWGHSHSRFSLPPLCYSQLSSAVPSIYHCQRQHIRWENTSSTTDHPLRLTGVYFCFVRSPHGTTSMLWVFLFSIYGCTMNRAYTTFPFS